MFLNLFGSDGPPGAHAGDYRNRLSIAMVIRSDGRDGRNLLADG